MEQRDIGRFIIKVNTSNIININVAGVSSRVITFSAKEVMGNSSMFGKLQQVFDQYKINAIKVRLVPTGVATPGPNAYLQSVLAWDRAGGADLNITYDMAASYGSAKLNYYTAGAKTVQTHFIAAETIGEKTDYVSTQSVQGGPQMWLPYLVLGLKTPVPVEQGQSYDFSYALEWSFDVTFRGTRYQ